MTLQKKQPTTKTNIAPQHPFVGQKWHDTTHDVTYVWVGRWLKVVNSSTIVKSKGGESFDPIKAYDRAKRIL